jgi:CheY-like chemotaxis protein/HPt (histidine-containing phosphotransfer) domain-containing protein
VHEADAANKAKSQFLANMSHEIRTPMNAVIGLIYVLEQGQLNAEQATTLSRIKVASRQLLAIIDDVLDLSKIEAGEMRVEQTSFDLRALVEDVTALMSVQAEAEAKGIALRVASAELPPALVGDPTRLRQVLINLLGNAIKFTEQGHVSLQVKARGRDAQGWTIAFAVEDTGVGITPDALARLFAPFVQADNSTTRRFGGTGLGLSIVRQLVALMGGEVRVQSAPGSGSRFAFGLVLPVGARENVPVVPRVSVPAGAGLRGVRVLVVDDNAINQAVAKRVLMLEGATVELADDGQQAVDRLRRAEPEIHIVLMDVQMPVMDGCDATRLVRDELGRHALPILGLTAGVSAEESRRARQAGMDDLVGKPFDPPLLVQRIRQWLEHRQVGPAVPADGDAPPPPPPPASDVEWPAVAGLDIPTAQRQLSHSLPLLRELLVRLLDRFADLPATPVAQRARRLHDLKGSAASIGARDIAARAAEAERALGHGNDAMNALEHLAAMLDGLKASASEAGLLEPPVTAPSPLGDAPDARALQDLVMMLRQNDLAALARFQDMLPGLRKRLDLATYRELKKCMEALDFDGAARALDAELAAQPH